MAPPPIIPKALPPNGKIAFISPSLRVNTIYPLALSRSVTLLESLGYSVTVIFINDGEDEDVVAGDGRPIAASIENRLAELRAAFADPSFDAIFCTLGGPAMTELIPYLVRDTELHVAVARNPKIVVGYSDITVLHWSLRALTGLRTFYGPCPVSELADAVTSTRESLLRFSENENKAGANGDEAKEVDDGYLQDFLLVNLLAAVSRPNEPIGPIPRSRFYAPLVPSFTSDPDATTPRSLLPSPAWTWLRPGRAEGRIFGGCLTVVGRIQGIAEISPDWKGKIMFLESAQGEGDLAKGNPIGRVRQTVADLAARGVFDEVAGLVIGRPYGYNTERERAEYAAVFKGVLCHGRLAERRFPILMNVDVGHTSPLVTLPMDAMVVMDSETDKFAVTEAAVV
ncbi:peptidase U61 LD-carboxypeptidase A protein [Colletotrichum truncatum]|uniref:Peptidase U61 LD-carboxypeptidase A protein n=1 Tax=Colletotrichum truncatum TaxID=5467 RepID=A0ACC3YXH5_COLTU|nr:peptidase U61 LD-carboxypeptidase A protein [Colletotrichum truncatum]KAF6792462.1 peptidase U61 LD-carboxypeptidase A protein [Colletotrichum truncatum]